MKMEDIPTIRFLMQAFGSGIFVAGIYVSSSLLIEIIQHPTGKDIGAAWIAILLITLGFALFSWIGLKIIRSADDRDN